MINIEKFQSEIQKNMQAMVNEHGKIIRENRELKDQVKQLEKQTLVVHISDGDNLTSDNLRINKIIEKVFKKVTKIIYVEVSPFTKNSILLNGRNGLKSIENGKFSYVIIKNTDEVDASVRGFATLHLN